MATERLRLIFEIVTKDSSAKKAVKGVGDEAKKSEEGVKKLNTRLGKLAKASKDIGAGLQSFATKSAVGFAALSASVAAATTQFARFDNELRGVKTLLNDSSFGAQGLDEGFQDLTQSVLRLGSKSAVGLSQLNKSLFDTISAGVDASESITVLEQASRLAVAGITDISIATDGITTALGAYGFAASDAASVAAKFFAAQVEGKTDIEQLSQSIGRVAATAASSGVSFNELLAAVSAATTAGIKTNSAFSALKAAISNVAKPTEDAVKEANRLGVSFNSASLRAQGLEKFLKSLTSSNKFTQDSVTRLFGSVEAQNIIFSLAGKQADKFSDIIANLGDEQRNATLFTGAFETSNVSLSNQFTILGNKLNVFAIRLGQVLEPAVSKVINALGGLFDIISEDEDLVAITAGVLGLGTVMLGAATAIGTLGLAVTGILPGLAVLQSAILAVGITLKSALIGTGIGAAIVAIGVLIADLATNWDKRVAQMIFIWERFKKTISSAFTFNLSSLTDGVSALAASFTDLFSFGDDSQEARKEIGLTAKELEELGDAFEEVADTSEDQAESLAEGLARISKEFEGINNNKIMPEKIIPPNFVEAVRGARSEIGFLGDDLEGIIGESIQASSRNFVEFTGNVEKASEAVDQVVTEQDLEGLEKLREKLENIGLTDFDKLQTKRDELFADIDKFVIAQSIGEQEAAAARLKVIGDFNQKKAALEDAALKEALAKQREAFSNPFAVPFRFVSEQTSSELAALAQGLLDSLPESTLDLGVGVVGAVNALGSGANDFVKTITKGIGAAFGPAGSLIADLALAVIDVFGVETDVFIERLNNTLTNVPLLLANIITNVAGLLSGKFVKGALVGFVESLPILVEALTNAIVTLTASPAFWVSTALSFLGALIGVVPEIVQGFINGIKNGFQDTINIFKSDFAKKVLEGFGDALKGINKLIQKFNPINLLSKLFKKDDKPPGKVEGFIGINFPFVTFAKGGRVGGKATVGGDSMVNDTVPALLSPGEGVIPRSAMSKGLDGIINFAQKELGMQDGGVVGLGSSGASRGFSFSGIIDSVTDAVGIAVDTVQESISGIISSSGDVFDSILSGDFGGAVNVLINEAQNQLDVLGSGVVQALAKLGVPTDLLDIILTLQRMGASIDIKDFVRNPLEIAKIIVKGFADGVLKPFLKKIVRPFKSDSSDSGGDDILAENTDLGLGGSVSTGILKSLPGLQLGGQVPNGFNENFPARLSSGENVLDRGTNFALQDFLENQAGGGTSEVLLQQILRELKKPQTAQASVQLNTREFANILIQLNRNNVRTA